jgi:RND family efflux transporter MFP subunit
VAAPTSPAFALPSPLFVRTLQSTALLAAVLALAACSKPVEKTEDIRPVRAIKVAADRVEMLAEFSGEVRPRIESRLGFRVGGKIVARKIEVGSLVKRGQVLMQLDPQDLQLAQSQFSAGLRAAESNRDLAQAELKRYQELREKNFVSQAVLDGTDTAFKAAQASYEQAAAGFRNQSNQTGYTTLVSDVDGVVTGVDAEVGQVVAAGTPVVRVAQDGAKEIVIGIPEGKVDLLRRVADVDVRTWANPEQIIKGTIREVAPIADPVTRTYTAKIAIPGAGEAVKLGMTAYVTFSVKTPNALIAVPLTALVRGPGAQSNAVWLVDNGTVRMVPVEIGSAKGNEVLLAAGVTAGQTVVTAGANQLKPGQKVTVVGDDPIARATPAAAAPAAPAAAGVAK